MSDWKITGSSKSSSLIDATVEMVTAGACPRPTEYKITNTETGETKTVLANNKTQLGETISRGNLRK